ncbi:CocE/NonD family hydrolase [Amycolatopsis magusensis]|uniref:Xaa-Pro dipeptidyl-peptidase n=1 Tax=Amycolatopsis magusensis TaxID=882444 RepID=A0ABS4PW39_9PSEU|nr:CocE/NonD family hydrolase [Amycolatopsis magusensis]MBP2182801.1 X-Pro dipeptidyl-peptidase [Amycolatopsis magusensis]
MTACLLPNTAVAAPQAQVRDGVSQQVFSYSDAIRETVYVESPADSDRDGRKDRVVADVIRPRETANGLKVPVIFQASPYFGRSLVPSTASADRRYGPASADGGFKDDDDDGVPARFPEYYDNYFVPRGYAVVQVDMPGTRYSEGCSTVDGEEQLLGVKAALDWLDGRATATAKAGAPVRADWDTGKVGWVGRSHRGTLANMVATMDVPNLKTIVPIDSAASWYPYMRNQGLRRFTDYARWTVVQHSNTQRAGVDRCKAVQDELAIASDDEDAVYNDFWQERDYVAKAGRVKASVLMVHGLNDWNVTTDLALDWWKALGDAGVQRKLVLTQQAHVDPIDAHRERWLPKIHQWMDHWLMGVQNGVMDEPRVELERSANRWETAAHWPAPNAAGRDWWFGGHTGGANKLAGEQVPGAGLSLVHESYAQLQEDMAAEPGKQSLSREVYLSDPLPQAVRFSGVPEVSLRAKASVSGTPLSAILVDYGTDARTVTDEDTELTGLVPAEGVDCLGQGTTVDTGCYTRHSQDVRTRSFEIVTKVQIDTENRDTLTYDKPVDPARFYDYRLELLPEDYVFKAGHRIGVLIAGTTCTGTEVPGTDWCAHEPAPGQEPWGLTEFEIDNTNSKVTLPVVPS